MRVVRNYWIDVQIEGQRTKLRGGPRARDGTLHVRLFQRDNGSPRLVLEMECVPSGEVLRTAVASKVGADGSAPLVIETRR